MHWLLERLRERAHASRRRIVFPEGGDERVIAAARRLKQERLVEPVLISKNTVRCCRHHRSAEFAASA